MTDFLFPISARINAMRWDLVSNVATARSIFTGGVKTVGRTGDRWMIGVNTRSASNRETYALRAPLQSLRASLRGQTNRCWVMDPSYVPRGSFPVSELLTNNDFSSGTTGWTLGDATMTVADRVARYTANGAGTEVGGRQAPVLAAYVPYCARGFSRLGRNLPFAGAYLVDFGSIGTSNYMTAAAGYQQVSIVTTAAGAGLCYPALGYKSTIGMAGDYLDVSWTSMARCTLVDNGPNLGLRSDEFDNAAWTKIRTTISANTTAPDGTSTADSIIEDSSTNTHLVQPAANVTVAAAAADYSFSVALKAAGRTWARIGIFETTSSTVAYVYVNLSTGVAGTAVAGANWANPRAFTQSLGNGWYYCTIVARKTNSATSIVHDIRLATADGTDSYTGNSAGNILAWRATLAQSSVPTRLVQSTSAAVAATAQTGTALYTKGWPASTSGLLLPGDRVQIGTQLNMIASAVNSDAAGLAHMQCALPWRTSPGDNDPIIIHKPMARCVLTENVGGWDDSPGGFSDFDFVFEEALDQ